MNDIFAIHTLLWNFPLFKYAEKKEDQLVFNILVCGLSEKADIFIKTVFSCGQMLESKVNFTLCDEHADSYIDTLFKENPGLKKNNADSYAQFRYTTPETDTAAKYNYIFISTGSQEKNASELKRVTKYEPSHKRLITVDAATSLDGIIQRTKDKIVMLNVDEPTLLQLNQMAFRAHRLWEKAYDERKPISLIRQQFDSQDDYYKMASLSNVLHIKYKLASVGINTDNLLAAAEYFNKNILNDKKNPNFKKIVSLEHKRWCAEKIISGWRAPTWDEFKGYAFTDQNKDHKYNAMKLHPCIAEYGDPDAPLLSDQAYSYWDKFDTIEKIESARISPLDKTSLKIHFLLRTLAEVCIKRIRRLTEDIHLMSDELTAQVTDFLYSVNRLIDNELNSEPAFNKIKEETLNCLSDTSFTRLRSVITDICEECRIVIQRNRYIDYKKLDFTIVEAIPYILTPEVLYSPVIKIYAEKTAHNVTAATVIEPERLVIVGREIPVSTRDRINQYFVNRGNSTEVAYIEYGDKELETVIKEIISDEEQKTGVKKLPIDITGVHPSDAAAAGRLRQPLFQYGISGLENIHNCPFVEYFGFSTQTFSINEICDLTGTTELRTGDLKKANVSRKDIDALWKIFTEYGEIWSKPNEIGAFFENTKTRVITSLQSSTQNAMNYNCTITEEYLTDIDIYKKAEELYTSLLNCYHPPISEFTVERAVYSVIVRYKCTSEFKSTLYPFLRPVYLCQRINPIYIKQEDGFIKLVEKMTINVQAGISKCNQNTRDILLKLNEKGFICNLSIDDTTVKFSFRDDNIHLLFDKKGNILEYYLYLNILDECGFPSVENGVMFKWGDATENEIDLIAAIPGMKMLFLSAKAIGRDDDDDNKIKGAMYEIKALADTLGFNAIAAVVFGNIDLKESIKKRAESLGVLWIDKNNTSCVAKVILNAIG